MKKQLQLVLSAAFEAANPNKLYTKEEVITLLKSMYSEFARYPTLNLDLRDNWIKNNL